MTHSFHFLRETYSVYKLRKYATRLTKPPVCMMENWPSCTRLKHLWSTGSKAIKRKQFLAHNKKEAKMKRQRQLLFRWNKTVQRQSSTSSTSHIPLHPAKTGYLGTCIQLLCKFKTKCKNLCPDSFITSICRIEGTSCEHDNSWQEDRNHSTSLPAKQ